MQQKLRLKINARGEGNLLPLRVGLQQARRAHQTSNAFIPDQTLTHFGIWNHKNSWPSFNVSVKFDISGRLDSGG